EAARTRTFPRSSPRSFAPRRRSSAADYPRIEPGSAVLRMLALTSGDPSGIGPEIAAAAWRLRTRHGTPPFYLLTDPALMAARAPDVPLAVVEPHEAASAFADALPVVPLAATFTDAPGRPDTRNAAGTVEAIERAVGDVQAGRADALVTCPIAKKPL